MQSSNLFLLAVVFAVVFGQAIIDHYAASIAALFARLDASRRLPAHAPESATCLAAGE